jgi:hypothetical protein
MLPPSSAIFTMKMKAGIFFETLLCFRNITLRHYPEDLDLDIHRRESLKSGNRNCRFISGPKFIWEINRTL